MWKFEVLKDDDGRWLWRLVQHNAVIIIESSETFPRRSDATRAAEAARSAIGGASIVAL